MYMYTHTQRYIHIYVYICIIVHTYVYTCIYTHQYTFMYIYIYICIHMCIYTYIYICVYTCMCIYMYTEVCNWRVQVECIRSGVSKAREQAGAALANACANSVENQVSPFVYLSVSLVRSCVLRVYSVLCFPAVCKYLHACAWLCVHVILSISVVLLLLLALCGTHFVPWST